MTKLTKTAEGYDILEENGIIFYEYLLNPWQNFCNM
jgi:hypothetical protein